MWRGILFKKKKGHFCHYYNADEMVGHDIYTIKDFVNISKCVVVVVLVVVVVTETVAAVAIATVVTVAVKVTVAAMVTVVVAVVLVIVAETVIVLLVVAQQTLTYNIGNVWEARPGNGLRYWTEVVLLLVASLEAKVQIGRWDEDVCIKMLGTGGRPLF